MPKKKRGRGKRQPGGEDTGGPKRGGANVPADNGKEEIEFEDPFEDEFEDDTEMMAQAQAKAQQGGDETTRGMDDDEDEENLPPAKVWHPGVGEEAESKDLDYDSTAYTAFHRLNVEWPCLTFDVLQDSLGPFRTKFPQTLFLAAGTQAANADQNKVMLLKVGELHRTKHDDDSDASDDDDDALDDDPILEERNFQHPGGVNRLRSMPQSPNILATMSDTGHAHIWDTQHLLKSLDKPSANRMQRHETRPLFTFEGHAQEGFAVDWSPVKAGRLITGDCSKHIYLWDAHEGSWVVDKVPFNGHTDSVEDLQFSPNEPNVFASCSVDKTIRIWDTRERKRSMLFVAAHKSDVNVISWNRKVSHLLCSGADDGIVKVWDLRNFKSTSPAANFKWHRGPITSVQWHPSDESILAVSSADNSVSTWDMALEADSEEKGEGADPGEVELPPQLLFVHQGQKDIKELRFHPQIPSLIITTALDGFNIFKPSNMN